MTDQRRRALLVRNPLARGAPSLDLLREAARPLVGVGWDIELVDTAHAGHARALAVDATRAGTEVVIACGGDGTVHEVVNGLVDAGGDTALAHVPSGTANVWAVEAGIPRDPRRALALLPAAREARVDVGRVTLPGSPSRYFLLMCSAGLDADVVRRVGAGGRWKRLLGRGTYALAGVPAFVRTHPTPARLRVDGQERVLDLLLLVAGNTRLYGGVVRLTGAARIDDGSLDICAFSGGGARRRLALTARALRGDLERRTGSGTDYLRGSEVELVTEHPLPVQADGEDLGDTGGTGDEPTRIGVLPGALRVLVAPEPNPLFSADPAAS